MLNPMIHLIPVKVTFVVPPIPSSDFAIDREWWMIAIQFEFMRWYMDKLYALEELIVGGD